MEKEVKGYYKYKSDIIFLLAGSGLWPDYTRCYSKLVRNFLNCLAFIAGIWMTFGTIMFCIENITNINVLTRNLGTMISYSSTFLKVSILTFNRKNITKLNRTLSDQFEKDLEKPDNRPYLLAHYSSFRMYFRIHYYYTGAIIFLVVVSPLLSLMQGKYTRAIPPLLHFNYEDGGFAHWGAYTFELMDGYFGWSNTVGPDSLFGLYTLHVVGELRLVSSRFRNIKSGKDYKKQLKICVDRHVMLMESKHIMQEVFGFLSVWLAITCAIVICVIIFESCQIENMTAYKAIYLFIYSVIKFVQAYTYAWFGHIINVESETCVDSISLADWAENGDLQFMNDVLIVLAQCPMYFEALSVMIIRMDMFSKIMNTSVSYFFLLKSLDDRNPETT